MRQMKKPSVPSMCGSSWTIFDSACFVGSGR